MLTLFVGAPLLMAFVFPPSWAFPTLGIISLIGALLLGVTPGFRWRSLLPRRWRPDIGLTLAFLAAALILVVGATLALVPWRFLELPTRHPELWIVILALYPFLSVAPQELLYRALFFERYGALIPHAGAAVLVNAALFGLAHAFYLNTPAILLSALGGLAFAYAHRIAGSFALACLWHVLAGWIVFTAGLGIFFYHGAIPSN